MSAGDQDIGKLRIQVEADGKGIEDAHRKGGQAAGDTITKRVSSALSNIAARIGGAVGGARGAGAARAIVGGISGGGGAAAGRAGAAAGGARAAAGGAALAPVAIAVAAIVVVGVAATKLAKALTKAARSIIAETSRLARVNAALAVVEAEKLVGKILRDIQRAATLQTELVAANRALERIRNNLAPVLNQISLALLRATNVLLGIIERISESVQALFIGLGIILANILDFLESPGGQGLLLLSGPLGIFLSSNIKEMRKMMGKLLANSDADRDSKNAAQVSGLLLDDLESLTKGATRFPRRLSAQGMSPPEVLQGPGGSPRLFD